MKKINDTRAELGKREIKTIIYRTFVALTLLLALCISFVSCNKPSNDNNDDDSEKRINYETDNLDNYISIEDSDYKNLSINVSIPSISDSDIDNEIYKVLASNRGAILYDGKYMSDKPINPGDDAHFWYRGYEIDKDGNQIELQGTCNFDSLSATVLTIGEGQFIPGFESGLIGKIPNQYSELELIKSGKPSDASIIYLKATYTREGDSSTHTDEVIRINLDSQNIEEMWGIGIADYLKELSIGNIYTDEKAFTCSGTNEKIKYSSYKVLYATKGEENPITLKTVFPYNYHAEEFKNKVVYFDVFVEKVVYYESAEMNDAFITETLKISSDMLSGYSGNTLTEKYRSYIKEGLVKERQEEIELAAQEKLLGMILANVEIKKIPESERKAIFDEYYLELEAEYARYEMYYETIEDFIRDCFGLDENGHWEEKIYALADEKIKGKLVIYSIMRRENILLTDEMFEAEYQAMLKSDYENYSGKTEADFESAEAYQNALKGYEVMLENYYGEDFYSETILYSYTMRNTIQFSNITNN